MPGFERATYTFRAPARVEIGYGTRQGIVQLLREGGCRAVMVVIDSGVRTTGPVEEMLSSMRTAGIGCVVHDGVRREPTVEDADALIAEVRRLQGLGGVVGIGGGSALDLAKIAAHAQRVEGSVRDRLEGNALEQPGLFTVMVPTTSGTGSEATPNAVLKDQQQSCKKALVSPHLLPNCVILDPEVTVSLPARATAETGIDALTHALECYIGRKSNPTSDLFALDAVRLVGASLRRAVEDGTDREARLDMAVASFYGGMAIANSGTGGVHALAYPLGGRYGVGHGLSNAVLLAEVMEFSAAAAHDKFVRLAAALDPGSESLSPDRAVAAALTAIRNLLREVGIGGLDIRVTEAEIAEMAEAAMAVRRLLDNNPRQIRREDAVAIYRKVLMNDGESRCTGAETPDS